MRRALGLFLMMILAPAMLQAQATVGEGVPVLPEVKTYEELRHAISEVRAASRVRVEKAVEQEKVREAWEIGKLIDEHVLQHKEHANYDRQVLLRLANDLGTSRTELSYMLQFARAYPIFPSTEILDWGDYRELLSLNNPEEREAIAAEAAKNKWTQKEVRQAVRKLKEVREEDGEGKEQLPSSLPGKPGTYRIIFAKAGPYAGELAIDLGFSNYMRLAEVVEEVSAFKEGDIVASFRDAKGHRSLRQQTAGGRLQEKGSNAIRQPPSDLLFTYNAYVYRVLDGDTIEAVVDLGYGITTTQTLRLRGIDAPEIETRDGMEAKDFVERELRSTETKKQEKSLSLASGLSASPVLIRTVKSDKYDRYLADLFFLDAQGRQVYLNNLLLEKGLAVRVRE